jgi:hypothetical protein
MKKMKRRKPRQLSLLTPDLKHFMGAKGWMLTFKPSEHGQVLTAIGSLQDVYDALDDWRKEYPKYYSAVIHRPTGSIHRVIKKPIRHDTRPY